MRLLTKGLLLVAVPIVFELALLAALFGVERQVAVAERWALQSKKVINQAEALLDPLLRQASRLRAGIIVGDTSFADKRSTWIEIADRLHALEAAVADNPEQTGRIARMRETIGRYREFTQRIAEQLRAGHRDQVIAAYRGEEMPREINEFRGELGDFVDAENKLQADRNADLQESLNTQQFMLWFAVTGSLAIAVLTAFAFARHIGRRIAVLTGNTLRLGTGESLAAPLAGSDEIAQLDAVLHDTSSKLARAERDHAALKADLQRRAAELARVNEELRQQTQDNEMFIYSVSHDLRSPLVNLQGFSRELKVSASELRETIDELGLPDAEREDLKRIVDGEVNESIGFLQSAVTRAAGIIDALLRLSRAGRVEFQWCLVDVDAVIGRVVDSLSSGIDARDARVVTQPLPPAWGDASAIEQIFANLIGNALAYLDSARAGVIEIGWIDGAAGTALTAQADCDVVDAHRAIPAVTAAAAGITNATGAGISGGADADAPQADGRAGADTAMHVYYVRDNGLGIPAASLSKVFSAFQRLHTEVAAGEGIGLALVKRMVERHRGRVWVESAYGVGSTFYVALPAYAPLAADMSSYDMYRGARGSANGRRLPRLIERDVLAGRSRGYRTNVPNGAHRASGTHRVTGELEGSAIQSSWGKS
jgi:signal transduction histidine kinase